MFRGSYSARVDDKGRFKIPADFLQGLQEKYGDEGEFFVTSWNGQFARLYPLRESADLKGEVTVLGSINCIDVWNKQRYLEDIRKNPLTADDLKALDELGV